MNEIENNTSPSSETLSGVQKWMAAHARMPGVERNASSAGINLRVGGSGPIKFRAENGGSQLVVKVLRKEALEVFAAFAKVAPLKTITGSKYLIGFFPGEVAEKIEVFTAAMMTGLIAVPDPIPNPSMDSSDDHEYDSEDDDA